MSEQQNWIFSLKNGAVHLIKKEPERLGITVDAVFDPSEYEIMLYLDLENSNVQLEVTDKDCQKSKRVILKAEGMRIDIRLTNSTIESLADVLIKEKTCEH